jgi:serine/threonine protein kinase
MGEYPVLGTSIVDAMKNPNISFKTNILIGGSIIRHGNRVIQYAGGFTTVFPFNTKRGEKIVVRCWRADIGHAKERTQAIANYLTNLNSPYFVDFKYVDDALLINGILYPIVTMDWVEGIEIADYIYKNKDEYEVIRALADNFLNMVKYLHQQNIAHGDLQHGNILVKSDGSLVLVDYDSMAVPALNNMKDVINGLPNYQHPNREKNEFLNSTLDYFSELVIYLSLLIFAEDDTNFSRIKNNWDSGHQNLLFSREDFLSPNNSKIIKIGLNSKNGTISQLTHHLCQALQEIDIRNLKPLEGLISELFNIETVIDKWDITMEERPEEEMKLDNTEIIDKFGRHGNTGIGKPGGAVNINNNDITNKF